MKAVQTYHNISACPEFINGKKKSEDKHYFIKLEMGHAEP